MAMTASQIAQKWATNLGNAGPSIQAGVQSVTEHPGVRAAANRQGYLAGVQANVDKWATNVQRGSLEEWKQKTLTLGGPRIATGAQAAIPKMTTFLNEFLPFQQNVTASTNAMPRGTLQQNIARMINQVTKTAEFRRS